MLVSLGNQPKHLANHQAPHKKHHKIPNNLPISDQIETLTDVEVFTTFKAACTLYFSSSVKALVETLAIVLVSASTTVPSFKIYHANKSYVLLPSSLNQYHWFHFERAQLPLFLSFLKNMSDFLKI